MLRGIFWNHCFAMRDAGIRRKLPADHLQRWGFMPRKLRRDLVFHRSHNGTKFASLPSSPRSSPVACKIGEPCHICFDDRDSSCMDVLYRGNGPDKERFNFTPAFY